VLFSLRVVHSYFILTNNDLPCNRKKNIYKKENIINDDKSMAQVRIELKTKKKTSRINECKCAYGYIIYIYLKKSKQSLATTLIMI